MIAEARLRTEPPKSPIVKLEKSSPKKKNKIWCRGLKGENDGLSSQIDKVGRESATLQPCHANAENKNVKLALALSDAEERIRGLT